MYDVVSGGGSRGTAASRHLRDEKAVRLMPVLDEPEERGGQQQAPQLDRAQTRLVPLASW